MSKVNRRPLLACALITAIAVLGSTNALSVGKPSLEGFRSQELQIQTRPVVLDSDNPKRVRFGKLDWLGGLKLNSLSPFFGG